MEQFTMAEACNRFAEIVRMAERGKSVRLFRRGKRLGVEPDAFAGVRDRSV